VIRDVHLADLDAIARMTATRHERSYAAERLLNPAFEDPAVVRASLPEDPMGWVLEEDGAVAASLLWEERGRWAFCHLAGVIGDPELVTRIYAVAAGEWVAAGHTTHALVVPTIDRGLADRLIDLSFGRQQAHAVRPLGDRGGEAPHAPDVEIQHADVRDLDDVVALGNLVAKHHEGSPVFDRRSNEFYEGLPESYERSMEEDGAGVLIARIDGDPVGLLMWLPRPPRPVYGPDSAELILLAVHPKARGRLVGRALTAVGLHDMAFNGHPAAVADWRTTNLEASRFWPALGFLPIAHRYVREVTLEPYIDDEPEDR
jgi:ribosomal protein S18 acetylase RimI-like enzyme